MKNSTLTHWPCRTWEWALHPESEREVPSFEAAILADFGQDCPNPDGSYVARPGFGSPQWRSEAGARPGERS